MENLKDLVAPKTFNRISYVAVISWILYGVTLLGIFAAMENTDSFRCEAKLEKMDLVRGKCSDHYNKQYNKSGIPVYGFVIANFSLIGIVCVIYSQIVKSRVDDLLSGNSRRTDPETQLDDGNKRHKLFVAYFCQLATRFAMGIIFIVLQTQVLYPDNFPPDFHCQIAAASHAANASSTSNIQNSTECHNQQATKITSWMNAVTIGNGVLALIILVEIMCILVLRVKEGNEFLEDSSFIKYYLPSKEPQAPVQEPPRELTPLDIEIVEPIEEQLERPSSVDEFVTRRQEKIIESTEKPADLKALFQVRHGEGKRNVDRKLDHVYTNLVLIPNRARYDFTGNREEQLKVYPKSMENVQPISREEIVDAKNKKILIVGRPGIGKTLFLTKWVRDWALGKAFNNFPFVFFLKFRKFNSVEKPLTLRDLLSRSEYPSTLSDDVWDHVLRNPERVVIFFDGLDEFLNRSNVATPPNCTNGENPMPLSALFYNIVEGNLLRGASVLTTTRPTAVSDVTDLPFNKTIEILGFASEQVEEYVKNFAKDAVEYVADAGNKIWEHINTNMNIFSLCYIPVNCFIICSCLLQVLKFHSEEGLTGVGLPTKLTEIYQRSMNFFFSRHGEHRDKDLRREDINSKHLPPEVEEKIKPLAKLAFEGLTQKRLIFGQKEVPEDLVDSALFHRLPDHRPDCFADGEAQYCFIHLTMQEFLAAKHITETMKGRKLRRFVAKHIKNGEWQLVLQFVAGLLNEQSIDIFTDLLPETTEEEDESQLMLDPSLKGRTVTCWPTDSEKHLAVTLIKCINETNESGSVVQSKLDEIGFNAVDFTNCRLAPADCTAVVHFIQSIQQISLINLYGNKIGSLGCVEIVKLFDNSNCQLRGLNLAATNIRDEGVKLLSNALVNNNCKVSSLDLGQNNITDEGVKLLSNALVNSNCKVSILILGFNNITDEGVKLLSNALVNNNKLRCLDLIGNKEITDEAKQQFKQANPNCVVFFEIV